MLDLFTESTLLTEFSTQQLIATFFIFIWTGFVRTGLGFGGAALGLPLMLLIDDSAIFWLPIVGFHLLFFTSVTLINRYKNIDWVYLKSALKYILPAKIIGVLGLLSLPNQLLIIIIYSITFIYSIMWLSNYTIKSQSGWSDKVLLFIGGYVSGTSLTGAPLLVAVFIQHVKKLQLRDTLFALWFIVVTIKLATFALFSFDLQIINALLLVPGAFIGHLIGLKAHDYILNNDQLFRRSTGIILLIMCIFGFTSLYFT